MDVSQPTASPAPLAGSDDWPVPAPFHVPARSRSRGAVALRRSGRDPSNMGQNQVEPSNVHMP
eukprot:scaffold143642_cov32-Tisochrysis_lutea.AAC.6